MMGKGNTHSLLVGIQTGTFIMQLNVENPWEAENFFDIYSKDSIPSYRDTCSFIFIAALFIIGRNQKESGYSSSAEWIVMMWCIYTMGYYLTLQNEIIRIASNYCKKKLFSLQVNG